MKRNVYEQLVAWRASVHRKPLVLRGARQTGKTYLLREFGRREYRACHYFNFEQDRRLGSLFERDLRPGRLIRDLEIYGGSGIAEGTDLIIFDEIQECNAALNALKYFAEEARGHHIASAGSLLGVRMSQPGSFPVGKVDFLDLLPMTFYEFLEAVGAGRYREYLESLKKPEPLPEAFHEELTALLRRYYEVGGMPEAVARHVAGGGTDFRTVQKAILDAYTLDFAKHAPVSDIPKLSLVWESLPAQLARENSKFLFSVVREGARAREFENAITWLQNAGLVHRCVLSVAPQIPLAATANPSHFKIYACDVGLLGALAGVPPEPSGTGRNIFSAYCGAFAENHVAQHLRALTGTSLYFWRNTGREAEVDFLVELGGEVFPVEAKSGGNLRGKSLAFYLQKYTPRLGVRVSLRNLKLDGSTLNVPLYAIESLPALLGKCRSWRMGVPAHLQP